MKRVIAILISLLTVSVTFAEPASARGRTLPETYVLDGPSGAAPEGVAVHSDGRIWVGSSATGEIYRGDIRHPLLTPMAAGRARERGTTLGIHTDAAGNVWSVGA